MLKFLGVESDLGPDREQRARMGHLLIQESDTKIKIHNGKQDVLPALAQNTGSFSRVRMTTAAGTRGG